MERKSIFGFMLAIIMLIIAVPTAVQAQSELEAALQVPANVEYTVGDPIEMTLSVTHPEGYQVIFPILEDVWAGFLVQSQSAPITTENSDETYTTSQIIDVRIFAPGSYDTPPLSLTVADGAGQLSEVAVPPASVAVQSVLVEGDSELRDIKPQADLPYVNLLPWVVAGIVILFLGFSAFLLWRRKQRRAALAEVDNRLPHEIALDELKRINSLNLPEQGLFKEYYTGVSDTLRTYMSRSYGFPVLERTTAEIQKSLNKTAVAPPIAREFIVVLDDSDLVKFSKFRPTVASAMQTMARAYHIIKETRPVLPSQESPPQNGKHKQNVSSASITQSVVHASGNGSYQKSEVKA